MRGAKIVIDADFRARALILLERLSWLMNPCLMLREYHPCIIESMNFLLVFNSE